MTGWDSETGHRNGILERDAEGRRAARRGGRVGGLRRRGPGILARPFPFAPRPPPGQNGGMSDLPFSVSTEAAAYIAECFRSAESEPGTKGLLPVLCQGFSLVSHSHDGTIESRFRGESWGVGYHYPEVATAEGFVPVPLCGRTVWIHPDGLRDLTGKRLVVETVAFGFPNPSDKMARLLRIA